jgi:hypothetical protein
VESKCVILDLVVAKQNINITNNKNNAYELNRHFQVTWALNPPWAKSILSFGGKVTRAQSKVCALGSKAKISYWFLSLILYCNHVGYCKALLTIMLGVKVKEHYFLKNNIHVANEKLYFAKGPKTLHRLFVM